MKNIAMNGINVVRLPRSIGQEPINQLVGNRLADEALINRSELHYAETKQTEVA